LSSPRYYKALFNRLLERKLSPQDTKALLDWLGSEKPDTQAAELILSQLRHSVDTELVTADIIDSLEARLPAILQNTDQQPAPVHFLKRKWVRYAAALIIVLAGVSIYLMVQQSSSRQIAAEPTAAPRDIAPGREGAILTLEDGSTVILDDRGNGLVANQSGSKVVLNNGQLLYDQEDNAAAIKYNTVTTPRGRQFQVVLPDGTKVWLNAASSLRYPTAFTGKERRVEITGEVYFEVARVSSASRAVPFFVKVNDGTEIEVLGTHFNINSYNNESSINTTLLEGSVKVSMVSRLLSGGESSILKPGEQAKVALNPITIGSPLTIDHSPDIEKVMAWKNGVFNFEDASLEEVMRQLERWYDIDVEYEKGVPKLEFVGKMGRDLTLSNVLRGLEVSKVKVRVEGRKVIVLP
jgi:transmembrane sensor